MDYVLLAAFIVYSLFVLSVGVWGYRKESFAAYAVADRSIGTPLATGAFVATFLSAITVHLHEHVHGESVGADGDVDPGIPEFGVRVDG